MGLNLAIIGTGYVGLVTGTCLAEIGHNVVCIDNNHDKIVKLKQGIIPIFEPGLESLVKANIKSSRLTFSTDLPHSIKNKDAIFICVGTPTDERTGAADLSAVEGVARQIAENLSGASVVVTKSTVPVGTNEKIARIINRFCAYNARPSIASNPEFLREGAAVLDFMNPDRIVVGTKDKRTAKVMKKIYAPLISREVTFVATSLETAETIKYASNAFLAVKVSFINEIADLCEKIGADVDEVANGMGLDARIGKAFLKAGPGWGGSCFPKDTRALKFIADQNNIKVNVVEAAIAANSARKENIAAKIVTTLGGDVRGKKIAVLGLTFKGQTDDMRDSPALDILPQLIEAGAIVHAYDPSHPEMAHDMLPLVKLEPSAFDCVKNADCLVVLADWKEFKSYDLGRLASHMRNAALLDFRNIYSFSESYEAGFTSYQGVGKHGYDSDWFASNQGLTMAAK